MGGVAGHGSHPKAVIHAFRLAHYRNEMNFGGSNQGPLGLEASAFPLDQVIV